VGTVVCRRAKGWVMPKLVLICVSRRKAPARMHGLRMRLCRRWLTVPSSYRERLIQIVMRRGWVSWSLYSSIMW